MQRRGLYGLGFRVVCFRVVGSGVVGFRVVGFSLGCKRNQNMEIHRFSQPLSGSTE